MSSFSWAYVNCTSSGGGNASGPDESIQIHTGAGNTTGSSNFMYHTNSYGPYPAHSVILSGTLVVSGTISASEYHIENVVEMDVSGSTFFGNSGDDRHVRTGSLEIYEGGGQLTLSVNEQKKQTIVNSLAMSYQKINATVYTSSASDAILGVSNATDTTIQLHTAIGNPGQIIVIKDEAGSRSVINQVWIYPSGSETIDASAFTSFSSAGKASINLYSDGSDWFIF